MNIEALLEFRYADAFVVEYAIVLIYQILLYLLATTAIAFFYGLFSRSGVGVKIEPRSTNRNQVRNEMLSSMGTCGVIAGYFYVGFAFIDSRYVEVRAGVKVISK